MQKAIGRRCWCFLTGKWCKPMRQPEDTRCADLTGRNFLTFMANNVFGLRVV